jgi:23S rRNA (uracil1939-C5)-methyltransferase
VTSPALAPGDIVEIECTDLIAKTGQAVGRSGGMVVYVLGPVPGERARVRIESVKAKYAVADLVEVLVESPDRREPFCPVFGACGGCQVQHYAYEAQLRWKHGIVENALRRIGGIADAQVAEPIGMVVPRAYRNKMAVVASGSAAGTSFGFYAARTHDVVPIHACPIVVPELDRTLAGLWSAAEDPLTAPAFTGARHVIARTGRASGETVVSITSERASTELPKHAAALAAKLPSTVGIANSYEPPSENAVMGRKNVTVFGDPSMREAIAAPGTSDAVTFRVSPASFFQVNSEMVGQIFSYLAPQAANAESIIDLYCGAGTFALFFARHGAKVVGIEENPTFLNARVEAMLRSPVGLKALAETRVVFLDPPRKGSDEGTLAALVRARVPHVWYLSCNPATLARDLAQLIAGGYKLGAVQPFDMFPQTGHIEALATLHREDVEPLRFGAVIGE